MCNKRFHLPTFFIKILLTFIMLTALYIPNIAYSQLCDRDGVCESGETESNCIFDCKISTLDKDIKIFLYALGVGKVIHFGSTYSDKTEITNFTDVKNFVLHNIDFSVDGQIQTSGPSQYIYDLTDNIPVVYYVGGTGLATYLCNYPSEPQYEYCQLANNHEEWFLHEDGAAITPQNRLLEQYWFSALYDMGSVSWRNTFTDYAAKYLDSGQVGIGDDNRAGIYYDVISDYYREWAYIVNKIETGVAVQEGLTAKNKIFKYVNTQKNIYPYSPHVNKVTVTDSNNSDTIYVSNPWCGVNIVFLDSSAPTGTLVDISYYYQAERPLRMTDEYYKNSTLDMLEQTRTKIGNGKLLIVNGYQGLHDYAGDGFLNPIDGAMRESFISRAENFSESQWISVIDQLKDISDTRKKIELVQAINDDNLSDADVWDDAMYQFASFLLGKGPWAYFNYTYGFGSWYQKFVYFDFYKTDIGSPYEDYHLRGNIDGAKIYEREFERVLVLVNPSDISANISLNKTFYTLMGNLVGSITLKPKSGIMLLKYSTGTTTTTTSVRPATTTTIQPATTTTSVKPATTTTVQPTTTTTVSAKCTTDMDCDDNLFCNGIEQCDNGICIQGSDPCQAGQMCSESRDQCRNVRTNPGKSFPKTISRPVSTEVQTKLLVVKTAEDNYFDRAISSVVFANTGDNSQGVKLNAVKKAFKLKTLFGNLIFLPIQVHKQAKVGQWEVLINTEVSGPEPTEETVISSFKVR